MKLQNILESDEIRSTDGSMIRACQPHKRGRLWKFKKNEIDEWVHKGGASETSGEHEAKE
jgi:hypothetical protein